MNATSRKSQNRLFQSQKLVPAKHKNSPIRKIKLPQKLSTTQYVCNKCGIVTCKVCDYNTEGTKFTSKVTGREYVINYELNWNSDQKVLLIRDSCHLKRPSHVKLILANSCWQTEIGVWTTQQHVGKLLARVETRSISRQQLANMLLFRSHTPILVVPARVGQHKFDVWRPLKWCGMQYVGTSIVRFRTRFNDRKSKLNSMRNPLLEGRSEEDLVCKHFLPTKTRVSISRTFTRVDCQFPSKVNTRHGYKECHMCP